MRSIDPALVFKGRVIVMVPHMDDGVLACGGTIAKLPDKDDVHIIYATDGMASPAPVFPWRDNVNEDLGAIRSREAKTAMGSLGVRENNIYFLNFADGRLHKQSDSLKKAVRKLLEQIRPAHIFVPFRYDCHRDHLALNRVVTALLPSCPLKPECYEYFVYYRYRLLPRKDIRKYIDPVHLGKVNISSVADLKRKALDSFESQTTVYYSWQTRPNLSSRLLDEVSQSPEFLLYYDPSSPGPSVFKAKRSWIRLVHTLEPAMKKAKDKTVAMLKRGLYQNERIAN